MAESDSDGVGDLLGVSLEKILRNSQDMDDLDSALFGRKTSGGTAVITRVSVA